MDRRLRMLSLEEARRYKKCGLHNGQSWQGNCSVYDSKKNGKVGFPTH